jgi:hypothetical protein
MTKKYKKPELKKIDLECIDGEILEVEALMKQKAHNTTALC